MQQWTQWIRVSGAALCHIERQGRYLLLLNHNRRAKGLYLLSPIGGGLELYDTAILERFDARLENPDEQDLRLIMPVEHLDDFRTWFTAGKGRERSPFRELHEELVCESHLLSDLQPDDVRCEFLRCVEDENFTQRRGSTGLLTHYFLEIYDVAFTNPDRLEALREPDPQAGAVWVTEEQIRQRASIPLTIDGGQFEARVRGDLLLPD